MNLSTLLCCGSLVVVACGCGPSRADVEATRLDQQVEKNWMDGHEVVNAAKFFEGGGHYEDPGTPDGPSIDRDHVLPLVKRLYSELDIELLAVLIDPETAFAVVGEIPVDEAKKAKIRAILKEADDSFSGFVYDNWGHKWLSLDFLNDQEVQVLKDAGAFETLAKSRGR